MMGSLGQLVVALAIASGGVAADAPSPSAMQPAAPQAVAAPAPTISLGIGWTVARARGLDAAPIGPVPPEQTNVATSETTPARSARVAQNEPDPASSGPTTAGRSVRPTIRPFAHHTDLDDRIRERRIARGLYIGAAVAVQAGMVIYGITQAVARSRDAEAIRDEPPRSQYNPIHPR